MCKKLFLIVLLISCGFSGIAQDIKITGTVYDADNKEPIPYASVSVKGTTISALAGDNGTYTISVPKDAVLLFFCMGYAQLEVPVNGQSVVNAYLNVDAQKLDDIVIVAYGTAKKESLTGAVQSVSAKSIETRPVSNVVSALEGTLSGVQINNTSGEPGSGPSIRIRGFTSVTGVNSPLYVVDGVPYDGSTADLNSSDIESISVLKDAASAALYGNRAANGVVLITTKRGKSDVFRVTADVQQGFYSRGTKEYEKVDAYDWMELRWRAIRNSYLSDPSSKYNTPESAAEITNKEFFASGIYNIFNKTDDQVFDANGMLTAGTQIKQNIVGDLDWFKPIQRVGHRQQYNISGDGATEKSNFFFSVNYFDEKGYIKTSDIRRFTGRSNVSISPRKWVKLGLSLSGSYRESNFTSQSSSTGYANPFYFARYMAPIYPVHLHDLSSDNGDYVLDALGNRIYDWGQKYTRTQNNGRNVVYEGQLDKDKFSKLSLDGTAFTEINFLKDFTFTIKGNYQLANSQERTYNNAILGDGKGSNGRASRTIYKYKTYNFQQQLVWKKTFGNLHNVDILLGHENYSSNYIYLYGYKTGQTFADKLDLINFSEITTLTDYDSNYKTESYLSRARYNYDNKYFLEASFRTDGSSRFHPDYRWGNFWSAGFSWVISKEKWMQNISDKVNSLKFRTSYGEVGNDQSVGRYAYMALYDLTFNGQLPAAYKGQYEAKDIKWESTNSFGAGIEGRFFDRFNLSVEYFDKRSKDLLFDLFLPLSAGAIDFSVLTANVTKNIGTSSNRGWEIAFDVDVLSNDNFNWNIGANATFLKNKITKLPEQNKDGIVSGTKKYVEGRSMYDYWLYQFVGVDQMTGKSLLEIDTDRYYGANAEDGKAAIPAQYLVNINGKEYTTYTTYAKKDWSGSVIPKVFGSFSTNINWKNFSANAIFTYSLGGKTYDNAYSSMMGVSSSPYAIHKDALKAWNGVPEGITETSANRIDPNGIPVNDTYLDTYTSVGTSNRWLTSASYLVFKNLNVGYSLPNSLCKKLDISSLRLSCGVENLFTITARRGMDPQQSFSGVPGNYFMVARTFSFGINVTL